MALTDFILNTEYSIDKIIGFYEGSITVASFNFNDVTLSHGFDFAPLYQFKWSTTSDFSISYQETGNIGTPILTAAQTTPTQTQLFFTNNSTSSVTIYYRVIYFLPFDENPLVESTQQDLDNFYFNSEQNYSKVYLEGYLPTTGGTINHDLGFIPQVEAWTVDPSGIKRKWMGSTMLSGSSNIKLFVTNTTLEWVNTPSSTLVDWQLYYKIYGDTI